MFFAWALNSFVLPFLKKCLGPRVRGAGFHGPLRHGRTGPGPGTPREIDDFLSASRAHRGGHRPRASVRPRGATPGAVLPWRPADGRARRGPARRHGTFAKIRRRSKKHDRIMSQVLPSEAMYKEAECYEGRKKNERRTQGVNTNKNSRQRQSRKMKRK